MPKHNARAGPSKPPQRSKKTRSDVPDRPNKRRADQPKKVKLRDRKTIPVPPTAFRRTHGVSDSDDALSNLGEDEDVDIESAGRFLVGLDTNALTRYADDALSD